MNLFYFALTASGIVLFFKDKKGLNRLFAAVDTYRKSVKLGTFAYIVLFGMFLVPVNFIDLEMFSIYAVLYLFVGVTLYGLYKNQPGNVLKRVSVLHLLGLIGRIGLEWMEWTPLKLFNIGIYAAIIPLYLYMIQLILTLKRFSTD